MPIFCWRQHVRAFCGAVGLRFCQCKIAATVFVLAFALCVWWSTKAVNRVSTVLIVAMVITFITSVTGMLNQLSVATLMNALPEGAGSVYLALCVMTACPGFVWLSHRILPSLMAYCKQYPQSAPVWWVAP